LIVYLNVSSNVYRMEMGEEPQVRTAASVFRNLCYNYRDNLSAGILVAGWDKHNGGQVCVGFIYILAFFSFDDILTRELI